MSNIVSPYKNIKQHTKIKLEPYHMNSDIRNHMKLVLKKSRKNVIKMVLLMKFLKF